jgi:hypothetical protein
MSDHERGAYTPPTDSPLSFDARQPVRGSRPIPFTLIISILVLVGLAAAIFVFYRSGVRQAGEAPQTVGTPVGEMKAPPPAEAQPQDPAAGLQIYKEDQTGPAQPHFTAPPEQPQPRAAPPAVVIAPAAAPTTPVTAGPALRPAIAPPPAPAVTPSPKVAAAAPPPAAKAPSTPPGKAPPAPVAKAAAPPTPAAKPAAGGAVVQIGAVSSTALADKAWNDAVKVAPGLAAGKGKSVEKIDKNGGVLYRTAVTGFASRDAAVAFCDKLKAAGKSCFVR